MKIECRNCSQYEGDCGYHFKNGYGHTNFEIPSECATDRYNNCMFYKPNEILTYKIAAKEIFEDALNNVVNDMMPLDTAIEYLKYKMEKIKLCEK